MKLPWHSDKAKVPGSEPRCDYTSELVVESRVVPGVTFTIAKMSFARRVDLLRRVRELARRMECLAASGANSDQMDAALLKAEIERLYVAWGVRAVSGLVVDSHEADAELLADAGPEELFREALAVVRRETGLSEEERKNS
jgi:hypothetical protein